MADIYSLLDACQTTPHEAGEQAQVRIVLWENWLVPVAPDNPTGDDPGYNDDFQQMREEVNKLSGADTELICKLAEKLLTTATAKRDLQTGWSCLPDYCSVLATSCIRSATVAGRRRLSGSAVTAYWTACLCIPKW